jgi:virulence-associated protein VagC
MKAVVGDTGVLIPRRMLRGVKEVEIRKQGRNIVVEPSAKESDPVFNLGKAPVRVGVDDGASAHDEYLYRGS